MSALKYLLTLADFDPSLAVDCVDILFNCVQVTYYNTAVTHGLEQLATVSALCCLHMLSHLIAQDQTQEVVEVMRQRYARVSSSLTDPALPISYTLGAVHLSLCPRLGRPFDRMQLRWEGYKPPSDENIIVAHALTRISRFKYQHNGRKKVPRWLLRFALHSLSQSPLPPTSVVINCLSVIAIDLDCDHPITATLDERCVRTRWVSAFLTRN